MPAGGGAVRRLILVAGATLLMCGCAGARPTWTPRPMPSPDAPAAPSAQPAAPPSVAPASVAPTAVPSADSSPSAAALLVTARDLSFTPRELTAASRAGGTLSIHNSGRIVHNLSIDELGVQIVASPGRTVSTDLADLPPGSYTFYCSVSGHRQAGMFGTLTVR